MTNNNEKKLYISCENRLLGYTPEENYDPCYYDLTYRCDPYTYEDIDEPDPEIIEYINENFGEHSYLACGATIYTENYDVQKFLQNEYFKPMWFDVHENHGSVADILSKEGWEW